MGKKIFITRKIDEKGIELLKKHESFDIQMNEDDEVLTKDELIKKANG